MVNELEMEEVDEGVSSVDGVAILDMFTQNAGFRENRHVFVADGSGGYGRGARRQHKPHVHFTLVRFQADSTLNLDTITNTQ
jgi:hypothetical protein